MFSYTRIVIVEDNPVIVRGLRGVIEELPDYRLISHFAGIRALYKYLDENEVDLLILDDSLPGLNTLEILSYMRFNFHWLKVLIYGNRLDLFEIRKYQQLGAVGYLYKDEQSPSALLDALNGVKSDAFYCSPRASSLFVNPIADNRTLSKRAYQVLQAMAEGLSPKEISLKLGTTDKAVYSAQDRLREQFGVHTNEAVIATALAQGLLGSDNAGSPPKFVK